MSLPNSAIVREWEHGKIVGFPKEEDYSSVDCMRYFGFNSAHLIEEGGWNIVVVGKEEYMREYIQSIRDKESDSTLAEILTSIL